MQMLDCVVTDVELVLLLVVEDLQGHCAGVVGQRQTVVDRFWEVDDVDGFCDETNDASPTTNETPTMAAMAIPIMIFL
jgi:hypothetical protein